jgi:two-component system, response regulator PdtaR
VSSVRSALICDNDPAVRTSIKNKLKELGVDSICEASNGKSAVSMAFECFPDIAILDAAMPEMSGLNAAREIRQKLKIPVILLISHCDSDTLNQVRQTGITTTLSKPFRGQDLLPAIELAFAHAEEIERLNSHVKDLQKTVEDQAIIYKAKKVLLQTKGLSESDAFRKIQKLAMDKQKSMRQIAEAILITEGV